VNGRAARGRALSLLLSSLAHFRSSLLLEGTDPGREGGREGGRERRMRKCGEVNDCRRMVRLLGALLPKEEEEEGGKEEGREGRMAVEVERAAFEEVRREEGREEGRKGGRTAYGRI